MEESGEASTDSGFVGGVNDGGKVIYRATNIVPLPPHKCVTNNKSNSVILQSKLALGPNPIRQVGHYQLKNENVNINLV